MSISIHDKPVLVTGIYTDVVEDHTLYYNPMGYGGVTVVDEASQALLNQCDGNSTVGQIVRADERSSDVVIQELELLGEREVISITEEFTRCLRAKIPRTRSLGVWLHLTNSCNLACSYCYIYKSPGGMSEEIGRLVIDKMLQTCTANGVKHLNIKLAGGEPLLRFELMQHLFDYAEQKRGDVRVSYLVLTNGTTVTKTKADYIASRDFRVAVSLDGVGAANDVNRYDSRGRGSYERVIRGLGILRSAGISPSIMTTVTSDNIPHLVELTDFLLDEEYRFRFSLERDTSLGKPGLLDHIPQLIDTLHQCYDLVERRLPVTDFTQLHKFGDTAFNRPTTRACAAGSSFFATGHDGKLGVCGLGLSDPFASITDEGDLLGNIKLGNPTLVKHDVRDIPSCSECVWRSSCSGACPLQTISTYGHVGHSSPYCEVYKAILPRVLRIKAFQMIRDN